MAAAAYFDGQVYQLYKGKGPADDEEEEEEEEYQNEEVVIVRRNRNGFGLGRRAFGDEEGGDGESSAESSSIGEGSSLSLSSSVGGGGDDEGEEEEEVQSGLRKEGPLGSLESLEDSLPSKRGLSNHFSGKAKSFASLADIVTNPTAVSDLAKPENPFNKRRRVLMAAKASWPRRASCSSLSTIAPLQSSSLLAPSLRVLEEEEEDEEKGSDCSSPAPLPLLDMKFRTFRSPRSFSLTDLQHHPDLI